MLVVIIYHRCVYRERWSACVLPPRYIDCRCRVAAWPTVCTRPHWTL